jgi:hypothetical protein
MAILRWEEFGTCACEGQPAGFHAPKRLRDLCDRLGRARRVEGDEIGRAAFGDSIIAEPQQTR